MDTLRLFSLPPFWPHSFWQPYGQNLNRDVLRQVTKVVGTPVNDSCARTGTMPIVALVANPQEPDTP